MEITFRPATHRDRATCHRIRYEDPEPEITHICGSVERARAVGLLLLAHGFECLPERTTIAEVDGNAVGLMEVWLPGDGVRGGPLKQGRVLLGGLRAGGPGLLLRYARHARLRGRVDTPRPADSLYIAHLDTHPEWRGRGIGSRLLEQAEDLARRVTLQKLSLDVYTTNPARRLYERHGYVTVAEKTDPSFERAAGVPGYASMLKVLQARPGP